MSQRNKTLLVMAIVIMIIISSGIASAKDHKKKCHVDKRYDLNHDGKINMLDLDVMSAHWGETYTKRPYPAWDVVKDGVIDGKDTQAILDHLTEPLTWP